MNQNYTNPDNEQVVKGLSKFKFVISIIVAIVITSIGVRFTWNPWMLALIDGAILLIGGMMSGKIRFFIIE